MTAMKTTYKSRPPYQKGYPLFLRIAWRGTTGASDIMGARLCDTFSQGSLVLLGASRMPAKLLGYRIARPTGESTAMPLSDCKERRNHAVMMLLHEHALIWQQPLPDRREGNYVGRNIASPNSPIMAAVPDRYPTGTGSANS